MWTFPTSHELGSTLSLSHVQLFMTPRSSVHGIFQERILEWVAISSSRGSSQPRDQTQVSCNAGRFFIFWATKEAINTGSSNSADLEAYIKLLIVMYMLWGKTTGNIYILCYILLNCLLLQCTCIIFIVRKINKDNERQREREGYYRVFENKKISWLPGSYGQRGIIGGFWV